MTLWSTLMYLPSNIKHIRMDKLMRDGRKTGRRKWGGIRAAATKPSPPSLLPSFVYHQHVLVTVITGFCDCAISTVYEEPRNLSIMCSDDDYPLNFFFSCVKSHMIHCWVHAHRGKTHSSVQSLISADVIHVWLINLRHTVEYGFAWFQTHSGKIAKPAL